MALRCRCVRFRFRIVYPAGHLRRGGRQGAAGVAGGGGWRRNVSGGCQGAGGGHHLRRGATVQVKIQSHDEGVVKVANLSKVGSAKLLAVDITSAVVRPSR